MRWVRRVRMVRADRLGRYPSSAMARRTFSWVWGFIPVSARRYRETVWWETPAAAATCQIVAREVLFVESRCIWSPLGSDRGRECCGRSSMIPSIPGPNLAGAWDGGFAQGPRGERSGQGVARSTHCI
ncbi:hypothetical protein GCM10009626_14570 [Brachybacterium sacelli]